MKFWDFWISILADGDDQKQDPVPDDSEQSGTPEPDPAVVANVAQVINEGEKHVLKNWYNTM